MRLRPFLMFLGLQLVCLSVCGGEPAVKLLPVRLKENDVREAMREAELFFNSARYAQSEELYVVLLRHPDFAPIRSLKRPTQPAEDAPPRDQQRYKRALLFFEQEVPKNETLRLLRQQQRETALFYIALSRFEMLHLRGKSLKDIIAEFRVLANNDKHYHFERPRYGKEARFYAARALLASGKAEEAVAEFSMLSGLTTNPKLDSETAWYLAEAYLRLAETAMGLPSGTVPVDKKDVAATRATTETHTRQRYLAKAVEELARLVRGYPRSPHFRAAERTLMNRRMELASLGKGQALEQYEEADRLAESFLRRMPPEDSWTAHALGVRGESALRRGRMQAAATFFRDAQACETIDSGTRLTVQYGLGRTYASLARVTGAERREENLRRARRAFREALRLMPMNHAERDNALYALARVLTQLEEYQEALERLKRLWDKPVIRTQAHYLAGVSCRGLGRYKEAVQHFEYVLHAMEETPESSFLLETLLSLAELERERMRYAPALLYYQMAADLARQLRDYSTVAASDLGIARAKLELGREEPLRRMQAAREFGQSILHMAGLQPDATPSQALLRMREAAFRGFVWKTEQANSPKRYDETLQLLTRLRRRYSERLRTDELDYVEGMAQYRKALTEAEALRARGWRSEAAVQVVLDVFDKAATVLGHATKANPRGRYAPRAQFLMGTVYTDKAAFSFEMASYFARGERTRAQETFQQEGKKMLEWSRKPYGVAIRLADRDSALRAKARMALGEAYMALDDFENARQEFQRLADDPDTKAALRLTATRRWAAALEVLGLREDALEKLRPMAWSDLRSAIMAGRLLEEGGQPREAYVLYKGAFPQVERTSSGERMYAAELLYRAHLLALRRAGDIAQGDQKRTLENDAGKGLSRLVERFPETTWAVQGILQLGEAWIEQGLWREAVQLARRYRKTAVAGSILAQATHILEGKAFLASDAPDRYEAMQTVLAYAVLERKAESPEAEERRVFRRFLTASAIRYQGIAAEKNNETEKALRRYGSVFARYHDVEKESDEARVAAGRLMTRTARHMRDFDAALECLGGLRDRQRMLSERAMVEAMKKRFAP